MTAREDGHCCGFTVVLGAPEWAHESCEEPNFAQICADERGQPWVEVGHGDDVLPPMTVEAAERLAASLTGLASEARKAAV